MTSYQSPTPNISLARAPITGANDLRTLLPEVARMFRVLQPIIENVAHLAEEVSVYLVYLYCDSVILGNSNILWLFLCFFG